MKSETLLDAIGVINDDSVVDAKRETRPVTYRHIKWAVAAACIVIGVLVLSLLMPSLQQNPQPPLTSTEPQYFSTEQALAEYLKKLSDDTDHFYRLTAVPTGLKFDSYSSYFSYVDWWYHIPEVNVQTRFIYLRWHFLGNGQEWLNNDLSENGAGRIELQVGELTYYYLLVDEQDVGWPKFYDIIWLYDGYMFSMNIPEGSITTNGELDELLLLKFTELSKVRIN